MIFEVATIDVKEGQEADFERGVVEALPIFRRAQGCHSIKLERSLETPSRYHLVVGWGTIEDHIDRFRNSGDFQLWRSLVGQTFSRPPLVEHTTVILDGFEGELARGAASTQGPSQ
jgi:heme-degrading monooxygenase HmoA